MLNIHLNHCQAIKIAYKPAGDFKSAKYTLSVANIRKSYPVPQDASRATDEYAILLEQFYTDVKMQLPKNGFNIFNLNSHKIAIPIQD